MKKYVSALSLLAAFAAPVCFGGSDRDAQYKTIKHKPDQPNVLLLITDEHNFRTIGAYRDHLTKDQALLWGDTAVETPNLDYLAKNGALFTSMYASSPVCSPSRSSMFTGMYPQNAGVTKNDMVMDTSLPTIASLLKKNGYKTGYAGKWHLSGTAKPGWAPEFNYGFDDNRHMYNRGHWKVFGFGDDGKPTAANGPISKADEKNYATDWLTDRAIEFIDAHADKPFFYTVSYPDPHDPNGVRPPYDSLYRDVNFKFPATFHKEVPADYPRWQKYTKLKLESSPKKMQDHFSGYWGMVKLLDDNVGRLIAHLKEKGLLENTIVIFSSDHGDFLGEHHKVNKTYPQEASARIPFILSYPAGVGKGLVVGAAANTADWMDTIASLTKAKGHQPNQNDGRDLTPLLQGDAAKWDDVTFMRYQSWVAAVTDRYKLIISVENKPVDAWLIDLSKDPDELTNALKLPENKNIVKRLAQELKHYGTNAKDAIVLDEQVQMQLNALIKL